MMDQATRDQMFAVYDAYARSFAGAGGRLEEMQQLKFDHSHRVAAIARAVAAEEGWPETDALLADVAGLYHDVGRYRQYREYRTFQDYRSIDHGECGWQVINEAGLLDAMNPEEREIVLVATRRHNAKDVPPGLVPRQERFLRLVRDSDKIDIYDVLYDNVRSRRFLKYPEIFHGVDPDGPVTPEVLATVRARQPQSYKNAKSVSDFLLLTAQWLSDFNFAASRRLVRERNVVGRLKEIINLTPEVEETLEAARGWLED